MHWSKDSHAYFMHRALSPNCKFLNGFDVSIDKIPIYNTPSVVAFPIISSSQLNPPEVALNSTQEQREFDLRNPPLKESRGKEVYAVELPEILASMKVPIRVPRSRKPNVSLDIDLFFKMMKDESKHLSTFSIAKWPHKQPTPQLVSKAGFFYCLLNDVVQCAYCRSYIGGWNSQTDPFQIHKMLFPHCTFIVNIFQSQTVNIETESTLTSGSTQTISVEHVEQNSQIARALDLIQQRINCKVFL